MTSPLSVNCFINLEESSFSFYEYLPSDNLSLGSDWPSLDLIQVARAICILDSHSVVESNIDLLSCGLLGHGSNLLPAGFDWPFLADQLSILYMRQFGGGGSRRLKMKAARANFLLRDLIDLDANWSQQVVGYRSFGRSYPWDWLPLDSGEVLVNSAPEFNVRFQTTRGKQAGFRLGLPTQIDMLTTERLSVTSCYSNGWYQWCLGGTPSWCPHLRPVVLVFCFQGETYYLDNAGYVFLLGDQLPHFRLPVASAWRARFVDGKVFVSDWSAPRRLTVLDTDGWQISVIDTGPVLLTNDLCKVGDTYYVIDKMQGRVFSYDRNFSPKDSRMSFGKGAGRLYDPIALRFHRGNLNVLCWLTGSLTEINLF